MNEHTLTKIKLSCYFFTSLIFVNLHLFYVAKYILRFVTKNSPQLIIFKRFLVLSVIYLVLDTLCYFIRHRKRPKLIRILWSSIVFGVSPLFQLSRKNIKIAIPEFLRYALKGILVWEAWWYPKWTYGFYSIMVSQTRIYVTVWGFGVVCAVGVILDVLLLVLEVIRNRKSKTE